MIELFAKVGGKMYRLNEVELTCEDCQCDFFLEDSYAERELNTPTMCCASKATDNAVDESFKWVRAGMSVTVHPTSAASYPATVVKGYNEEVNGGGILVRNELTGKEHPVFPGSTLVFLVPETKDKPYGFSQGAQAPESPLSQTT